MKNRVVEGNPSMAFVSEVEFKRTELRRLQAEIANERFLRGDSIDLKEDVELAHANDDLKKKLKIAEEDHADFKCFRCDKPVDMDDEKTRYGHLNCISVIEMQGRQGVGQTWIGTLYALKLGLCSKCLDRIERLINERLQYETNPNDERYSDPIDNVNNGTGEKTDGQP